MKRFMISLLSVAVVSTSCHTSKKTTQEKAASSNIQTSINGAWELELIPYPNGTFEQLYPSRKPTITFNEANASFNAFTGCNTANGKLVKDGNKINFSGDMMMTKMACTGDGEKVFLDNIKKVNRYSVSSDGKTLTFIQGDIALMRFHKSGK